MPFIEYDGNRILYIHVPKTGGGSVEEWMGTIAPLRFHTIGIPTFLKCTPQHFRMNDFVQIFGEGYFDFVFMTTRNPYDRILSEYKMHARFGGDGFWKAWPTFSQWLENSLDTAKKEPTVFDNHLRPQWEFLGTGVEPMRFENGIPAIIQHIAIRIGAPDPIIAPHKHSSEDFDIKVDFDLIDRLRIQDFYRMDFEILGYDVNDFGNTTNK